MNCIFHHIWEFIFVPIDELYHFSRWAHCTTNQYGIKMISALGFQESPGISGHFWSTGEPFFERIRSGDLLDRSPCHRCHAFWENGENDDPLMANPGGMGLELNSLWRWAKTSFLTHILGILGQPFSSDFIIYYPGMINPKKNRKGYSPSSNPHQLTYIPNILSGMYSNDLFDICSDILSDILSDSLSGSLSCVFFWQSNI